MPKQLDYFREYLKMIQLRIGKERTQDLIKKALVVVSAGTNDFVVNYMALPFQQKKYTIEEYQNFLLLNLRQFLQVCYLVLFHLCSSLVHDLSSP